MRGRRLNLSRLLTVAVLLLPLVLLLSGCESDDAATTFSDDGAVSEKLFDLIRPIFYIAAVVFVLVEGAILFIIFRYRRKPDQDPRDLPPQIHGNNRLELTWTILPALVLAGISIPTVQTIVDLSERPENSLEVIATAHQWWWEFEYPELGVTTAGEMHIPVDRPIYVTVRSEDVIHNFWVPRLAGKIYAIPNHDNHMWLDAKDPGVYFAQCAEFCGTSHARMKFAARAVSQAEFDEFVAFNKRTPAPTGAALVGQQTYQGLACIGCHAITGISEGQTGPNLTNFATREKFAGWYEDNNTENLRDWLRNPSGVKPGALMPNLNLTDQQIEELIAYMQSLKP